jgi:hypothetical protein
VWRGVHNADDQDVIYNPSWINEIRLSCYVVCVCCVRKVLLIFVQSSTLLVISVVTLSYCYWLSMPPRTARGRLGLLTHVRTVW